MRSFEQFLNEQQLVLAASILEERQFPLTALIEWYLEEGYCLTEDELNQIMEAFWNEESFWGDTWKHAAKGAGIGAGAGVGAGTVMGSLPGAGIGAVGGGALGGVGGGLYGMGKHLWNKMRTNNQQKQQTPTDNAGILKKLSTDHPDLFQSLGLNPDELIAKLNKSAWPGGKTLSSQTPHNYTPDEEEWMNAVHGSR